MQYAELFEPILKGKPKALREFAEAMDRIAAEFGAYAYVKPSGPAMVIVLPVGIGQLTEANKQTIIERALVECPSIVADGVTPEGYKAGKKARRKEKE